MIAVKHERVEHMSADTSGHYAETRYLLLRQKREIVLYQQIVALSVRDIHYLLRKSVQHILIVHP